MFKKKGKFKISNVTCKAQARNAWHGARLSLSLAVAEDSLASAKIELRSALRSAFAIFEDFVLEDWLRRSPYASTVLEQVRDGIRLKRGFGCGSAMSIKQVCCHCAHLSLSLIIEDWLRRSPYASTVLEQVRDGIRLKRGFGCGSAMSIKQVCCHCAHLSLSLLFRYRCVRKVDAKGGI